MLIKTFLQTEHRSSSSLQRAVPVFTVGVPQAAVSSERLGALRQATAPPQVPEAQPGTSGAQGKVRSPAEVLPVAAGSGANGLRGTGEACLSRSQSSVVV